MDKVYGALIGLALAGFAALTIYLRGRRVGKGLGTAKQEAKDAIREITEAVEAGDDERIQRLLADKLHEK